MSPDAAQIRRRAYADDRYRASYRAPISPRMLDRYLIVRIESWTGNRVVRAIARMVVNPGRTVSNGAQGRALVSRRATSQVEHVEVQIVTLLEVHRLSLDSNQHLSASFA